MTDSDFCSLLSANAFDCCLPISSAIGYDFVLLGCNCDDIGGGFDAGSSVLALVNCSEGVISLGSFDWSRDSFVII